VGFIFFWRIIMQIKKLILALATVVAAPAAFAVDLTTSPVAVPVDNQLFLTGATAQSPGIALSVARLCTSGAGTLNTLTDGLAVPVLKAWKCDAPATATYADMPGITGPFIVYKNEGGSLGGINPLRTGANTNQLNAANCTLVSGTKYSCAGTVAKPTHLGFSDVSEKIFKAKNLLSAQTAGNVYTTDIPTGAGQGFGIVVSPALYTLLQADQGTSGQPSISRAQYASLTTQTSNLWDVLLPNATSHASQPLTIARRGTTSGTQASAELYFLGNPCLAGLAPIGGSLNSVAGSAAGTSFGSGANQFIFKQEASSDAVLADAASATAYVIGVVSLENPQPASSWKYVAIGGVSPGGVGAPDWQRVNTLKGSYDFAYESFMFQNTKASIGTANLLGNIGDLKNAFQNDLGVGANLATNNGIYADPNAPQSDFGAETAHYSRGGNECQTPQFAF
jgi:hypothetical protein